MLVIINYAKEPYFCTFLYIKSECLYKETQNLLKISDKTDGNFVQLHKHTQGTEQCICLKKALQTSQGRTRRCAVSLHLRFHLQPFRFHLSLFTFHFSHKKNEP